MMDSLDLSRTDFPNDLLGTGLAVFPRAIIRTHHLFPGMEILLKTPDRRETLLTIGGSAMGGDSDEAVRVDSQYNFLMNYPEPGSIRMERVPPEAHFREMDRVTLLVIGKVPTSEVERFCRARKGINAGFLYRLDGNRSFMVRASGNLLTPFQFLAGNETVRFQLDIDSEVEKKWGEYLEAREAEEKSRKKYHRTVQRLQQDLSSFRRFGQEIEAGEKRAATVMAIAGEAAAIQRILTEDFVRKVANAAAKYAKIAGRPDSAVVEIENKRPQRVSKVRQEVEDALRYEPPPMLDAKKTDVPEILDAEDALKAARASFARIASADAPLLEEVVCEREESLADETASLKKKKGEWEEETDRLLQQRFGEKDYEEILAIVQKLKDCISALEARAEGEISQAGPALNILEDAARRMPPLKAAVEGIRPALDEWARCLSSSEARDAGREVRARLLFLDRALVRVEGWVAEVEAPTGG